MQDKALHYARVGKRVRGGVNPQKETNRLVFHLRLHSPGVLKNSKVKVLGRSVCETYWRGREEQKDVHGLHDCENTEQGQWTVELYRRLEWGTSKGHRQTPRGALPWTTKDWVVFLSV